MPTLVTQNPLQLTTQNGFESNNNSIDGGTPAPTQFSLVQNISASSDVTFNTMIQAQDENLVIWNSANTQNMVLGYGFISGSNLVFGTGTIEQGTGMSVTENYTHSGSLVVNGAVSFGKMVIDYETFEVLNESGSTKFGDDLADNHERTGSVRVKANSVNLFPDDSVIVKFSDDEDFSLGRQNVLVTERAVAAKITGDSNANLAYLRGTYAKKASSITNNTASFTATTSSLPTTTELSQSVTSLADFQFFNNGMLMEYSGLSIKQDGDNFLLKVDSSELGYDIVDGSSEIVAYGKFNV